MRRMSPMGTMSRCWMMNEDGPTLGVDSSGRPAARLPALESLGGSRRPAPLPRAAGAAVAPAGVRTTGVPTPPQCVPIKESAMSRFYRLAVAVAVLPLVAAAAADLSPPAPGRVSADLDARIARADEVGRQKAR